MRFSVKRVEPDADWLAGLYDACGGQVYAYAAALLGNAVDAEDVVQEVFVRVHAGGRAPRHPRSYLFRAARNEIYSRLRRKRLRLRAADRLTRETHFLHAPAETGGLERRDFLEAGLRSLPPKQRELVVLKVYQAMTFQEIASLLGIPANTAASRYRYAMERLRKWCNEQEAKP